MSEDDGSCYFMHFLVLTLVWLLFAKVLSYSASWKLLLVSPWLERSVASTRVRVAAPPTTTITSTCCTPPLAQITVGTFSSFDLLIILTCCIGRVW